LMSSPMPLIVLQADMVPAAPSSSMPISTRIKLHLRMIIPLRGFSERQPTRYVLVGHILEIPKISALICVNRGLRQGLSCGFHSWHFSNLNVKM
jgi:hypothetical protein